VSRQKKDIGAACRSTRYSARDGAVAGKNLGGLFNRPLYVANTNAFVIGGDLPVARFGGRDSIFGTFLAGVRRSGRTRWLHEAADIGMEYRSARLSWVVRDPLFAGLTVGAELVALGDDLAFAIRLEFNGARKGDTLVWAFGGNAPVPGGGKNANWDLDPHPRPAINSTPLDPALCKGNRIRAGGGWFSVSAPYAPGCATLGRCSEPGRVEIGDAHDLRAGPRAAGAAPIARGSVRIDLHPAVGFSFARRESRPFAPAPEPAAALASGLRRSFTLGARIQVETPDAQLNVAASLVAAALDGAWYPPVFRHGAMLWNNRYPGWRTMCGGTAAGWHDRVRAEAEFYCGHQVSSSRKTSAKADPASRSTIPARNSRFYGRGRILEDQGVYDMQSQFFDQLIHAWRWTGDADLEKRLRPALELHLEWMKDCFDPEGDGLYESVINVWPTDSVWYGGGGGAEATSYAYAGHRAARELALRAGDGAAARRHGAVLDRIRRAFANRLWIRSKGHSGLYREMGGLGRLHEDAWLYSIFLPIDAGLVDPEDAAASLHYSEAVLQNDPLPFGGRRVWTSNFVPGIWSVREAWPGDNHHLALAYFKTGLAADGWDIFRGNFLETAFEGRVPGDFGHPLGGTDFGDSTHMFARTLIEGLFGFSPDYPNGIVRVAPQFPDSWDRARLRTADVSLEFERRENAVRLKVEVARPGALDVRISVCAREILSVTVDGGEVAWFPDPGFGHTVVRIAPVTATSATVEVTTRGARGIFAPVAVAGVRWETVRLRAEEAVIRSISDRQAVLGDAAFSGQAVSGRLIGTPGAHTVAALVEFGTMPQWRLFRVQVAEARRDRAPAPVRIPARAAWECVNLARVTNGDVRTIYKQRYLSPRPETISVRIGLDGYSPWTFVYWQSDPPEISLNGVPALLEESPDGPRLRTPQGVPFAWPAGKRNVAFASRWDNWPTRVSARVGLAGEAAWFLVCGSTNPMQCRIANAVLRLRYADGVEERLELVPPVNYWNLSPIRVKTLAPGQENRDDYTARTDAFCIPAVPPQTVRLGDNCRAMLLSARLRPGVVLEKVTLEALSQDVVVGLMGLSIMGEGK